MSAQPQSVDSSAVRYDARKYVALAVFLGAMSPLVLVGGVAGRDLPVGVILAVLLGGFALSLVRFRGLGRVSFVIDHQGLTLQRQGRTVPWGGVATIRVRETQGVFGLSHRMTLELAAAVPGPQPFITTNATNQREVELSLDWLAKPWMDVVALVEQRSGKSVHVEVRRKSERN